MTNGISKTASCMMREAVLYSNDCNASVHYSAFPSVDVNYLNQKSSLVVEITISESLFFIQINLGPAIYLNTSKTGPPISNGSVL